MEYESYFLLLPKYLLILIGSWPKVNSFKVLYLIYGITFQSYFLFFYITFAIAVAKIAPTLQNLELANFLTYVFVYGLALWKVWLVRKPSVKNLIKGVASFEKTLQDSDPTIKDEYRKHAISNMKLITYLPAATFPAFLLFTIGSLNDFYTWKNLENEGLNVTKHLIFPEWLPKRKEYFSFYYYHQIIIGLVGGLNFSLVDSLIISLINYTVIRIVLLGMTIETLFSNKNRDILETRKMLGEIIHKHQEIISHIEKLNETFKWFFLFDFAVKSYQLSLILVSYFDENTYTEPTVWIIFQNVRFAIILLQFAVVYYQANKVTIQSEELGTFIYKSEWVDQPIEITRPIIIMITRTRKVLKLESFGIVVLSNNLTLKILKAGYTYIILTLGKF